MLTLNDGRKELYQWDSGRTATVDIECDVVHFANLKYGESLAVEVKVGKVAIPNKLLMNCEPIYCWAFVKDVGGAYTKKEQTLAVIKRAKPSDYVYTETDVINVKTAVDKALEEAKASGDFKGEKGDKGDPREVVQGIGQSTEAVMSQKATTDEINALKSDLSDKLPKSPADWKPWTSEEQAMARARIGEPQYELIETITLEEEAVFSRNVEPNGTPYSFKKMLINIEVPAGSSMTKGKYFSLSSSFNWDKLLVAIGGISAAETTRYVANILVELNNGVLSAESHYRVSNSDDDSMTTHMTNPSKVFSYKVDKINAISSSNPFPVGTNIKIYGVRL